MRVADGAFKVQDTGAGTAHYHRLANRPELLGYTHPSHRKPPTRKPSRDWDLVAARSAADADQQVQRLAELLGVDAAALRDLGTGWSTSPPGWTFPERDAAGRVVGVSRRLPDGTKGFLTGGHRGLTYALDWSDRPGPVLLVEGASDVAAMWSCGLAVIGRPSNTGGVDLLAELLADHADRQVLVIGERDEKEDGLWPGRDGAKSTATRLADALRRPVSWSLPPEGSKDVRQYLNARRDNVDAWRDLLDHFQQAAETCRPADLPTVEPYREPTGDVVDLDAWRDQMKAARLATLGQDGLFLDTSPTGAGKSHADLEAMRAAGRSLTVLPDHANCQETAAKLRNAGLDAAAFPPLNKDTCANLDEAQAALSAGLAVGAAVCPGCPCLLACQYHQETEAAERSDHAVATHKRAALSFPRLAADRGFVAVHEDARDLLAPTVGFRGRDLANLQDALAAGRTREDNSPSPDPEMHAWLVHLTDLVDQLLDRLDAAETSTPLDLDLEADQPPPNWQRRLWQVLREDGSLSVNGDALRAVVALATGGLRLIAVQVDNPKGPGGADQVVKSLVAVWWTVLPAGMPIWFEDATATAETLGRLTNQRVQDLTPAGRLAVQVPAVQVPADITRGTSTDRVASWLRGILAARPHARRVGLIGHRVHVKQLVGRRTPLDEDTRSRIHRSAYFGQGPDRGSNTWLDCDLLVVLGTPRVPPASVRRDLIRQGQVEAAGDKDAGRWGPRRWQGRTTAGDLVVVQGAGYAAPAWSDAARDQVRANLVQAVGRGRGVLANGVPVVVVSNEPLDLPLDPGAVQQVPERVREAAELVRRRCSENAKEIHLGEPEQPRGVQTAEIAKLLGVSPSTASERLAAAAAAGLVVRSDRRKGGWLPPPPPEPDQESDPETLGSGDESPVTVVGLDNLVQVVAALPPPGPPDETDQDRLTSTLDAAVAVVERLDATLDNLVRGAAQMLPDEPDEPGEPPPPQGNLVAFWRIHGPPRFSEDESTLDLRDSDAGFRAV